MFIKKATKDAKKLNNRFLDSFSIINLYFIKEVIVYSKS